MNKINSASLIDWAIDDNGDLEIPPRFTTGVEAVAQGVAVRLRNFKGEWFLDLNDGVPWFQSILGHKHELAQIVEILRAAIVDAPGVTEIKKLETSFDAGTRRLEVFWEVVTVFGDTVSDSLAL